MRKISYKAIAEIIGCSPSMVSRVMNDKRNSHTKLGKKIIAAANLYQSNIAIQEKQDDLLKEEIRRQIKDEETE